MSVNSPLTLDPNASSKPEDTTDSRQRPYTGPSIAEMIRTHTLAENIIKYNSHPTSGSILDDYNLSLLRRFVENPDERQQILEEAPLTDVENIQDQYHGPLAGYIILRSQNEVSESVQPILTNEEIGQLQVWFASGAPDDERRRSSSQKSPLG